ncbi:hypothetical protein ACFCV8_06505 [Streptomyces sp. NPDC056347]|uniref:effector-associated constant component EACC1 n=1 Tax=Streptomyces sp. NPDC056347 TaxID=3345790 RepID=UPI0035E0E64E
MLTVSGEDDQVHLRSLRDWLTREDLFRGRLSLQGEAPRPGQMGAAVEVLMVAVGSGGAATVLARSVTTWLTQRRADVKVTVQTPGGSRIVVDVKRAADPERVIAKTRALLDRTGS